MLAAERAAWLRLVATPGLGPRTARDLLSRYGLPDAIFGAGLRTLLRSVPEELARILAQPATAAVQASIDATEHWLGSDPHHALLTLADADYPQALLTTTDPPLVLFAIGRLELLNRPSIAIVGSRNATAQGNETAQAFAGALTRAGITVTSGLALGIDASAHRGALAATDSDASTVAVVGTGIDVIYPASNRALTTQIRKRGVVISEFPLRTPAIAHNFPRRNRIIAGLSRGTLVVEAALRSGSLITARLAADNGREVFAVPGSIHSPLSKGCHRLIREGAKLVESAQDILEEIGLAPRAPAEPTDAAESEMYSDLLQLMGHDPVDLDRLVERSGRAAGELVGALLELELAQHVARLPGNRYQRLR